MFHSPLIRLPPLPEVVEEQCPPGSRGRGSRCRCTCSRSNQPECRAVHYADIVVDVNVAGILCVVDHTPCNFLAEGSLYKYI